MDVDFPTVVLPGHCSVVPSLARCGWQLDSDTPGNANGKGGAARFIQIYSLAYGKQGNTFGADPGNHSIVVMTPDGNVTTLAGSTQGFCDGQGD